MILHTIISKEDVFNKKSKSKTAPVKNKPVITNPAQFINKKTRVN